MASMFGLKRVSKMQNGLNHREFSVVICLEKDFLGGLNYG